MTVFMLAEALHKFAWEVEQLPMSEFMAWLAYFEEKARKQEAESGNLLAMEEDDMIASLTGG